MADYENLLDSIDAVIKSNNRREITGQILQNTLHQMVGSLGENYQLAGFATPTLDPNSPDQNVFYVTDEAGVYTNFDNITLGAGLSFLMWKNEEWTSKTLDIVTADWVDEHYVSKAFLRKVFQFFDEDGVEIFPNDTESVVDNIKAMCGLWTNEYLSALGLGEGSTIPTTLAALNDVTITNPQDGQALVYDAASLHWVNATIQSGVDMSVVWAALAGATNEQINISHLTTALNDYVTATSLATTLQSYVTTSALATELANYASQSWVETNYVSKAFFNSLFEAQDVNGNAITPNNSGQTTIDRLKILVGAYTEQYLSALGLSSGGGGGGSSTLAGLNDVTITNPQDGQALIYDAQSSHWVNGAAISMSAVWTALAAATSEQINSSHLTTALSGYVTTSALASELANYVTTSSLATTLADYVTTSALTTTLADYGSKTWIDNNYVSKAFFNRLFQAFAPLAEGQTEPTQVEPNDTTTTIDNIKAMFGLWTEQYLSALGLSAGGGGGYTLNEPLASINNAALGTPSQANVAIVWNGTAWTYGTTMSSVSWNDVTNKPTTLSGYGITDAASTSDLANYLPLTGGNLSGQLKISSGNDAKFVLDNTDAETKYQYISFRQNNTEYGYLGTLGDNDLRWNTNVILHSGNISSYAVTSLSGYATTTWVGQNYLPLSGGTMTGHLYLSDGRDIVLQAPSDSNDTGDIVFKNGSGVEIGRFWLDSGSNIFRIRYSSSQEGYTFVTSENIGSQSVNYANSAGSVAWANVTGHPTALSSFTNDSGYVTSSGVTSVATGTGLTGGTITSTGTISIDSTYQTYISHGESAYNSLSNYLLLAGGTMTGAINYNYNGTSISYNSIDVFHCYPTYIQLGYGSSNSNMDTYIGGYNLRLRSGANSEVVTITSGGDVGIGSTSPSYKLYVNGTAYASNIRTKTENGAYVQIGGVRLVYDSANNAIKVVQSDGSTAANFYATGGISALGQGSSSGTGYLPISGGTMTGAITFDINASAHSLNFINGEYLNAAGNMILGASSGAWGVFKNNKTPLIYAVQSNGYVGIGTNSPSYMMHVNGDIAGQDIYIKKDFFHFYTNNGYHFLEGYDTNKYIQMGYQTTANGYDTYIGGKNIHLRYSTSNTEGILLNSSGNVGIGTNAPSYKLHVNGQVGATGFVNTSDERLKYKIEDKNLSIESIAKAPLFTFRWNRKGYDNDLHLGTSAQYWKGVLPEVVTEADDDIRTLSMQYGITAYASVVSVAREVLSQKEEIELLKNKVKELGKENEYLREEISRLKVA